MSDVAAIILAAGRGARFGVAQSKLTSFWRGKPIIRHVCETALASSARPAFLVTGHDSVSIAASVEGLLIPQIENVDHAKGLSTSLRAGLDALDSDVSGVLILLGDMPAVAAETLERLIAAHRAAPAECLAIVPRYQGRRGNPALLRRPLFPSAKGLTGDEGAGRLLAHPAPIEFVDVDDPGVVLDIDVPADLQRLGET